MNYKWDVMSRLNVYIYNEMLDQMCVYIYILVYISSWPWLRESFTFANQISQSLPIFDLSLFSISLFHGCQITIPTIASPVSQHNPKRLHQRYWINWSRRSRITFKPYSIHGKYRTTSPWRSKINEEQEVQVSLVYKLCFALCGISLL